MVSVSGTGSPELYRSTVGEYPVADVSLETMTGRSRPVSIGIIIKLLLDGLTSDEEETRNIAPPGQLYHPSEGLGSHQR